MNAIESTVEPDSWEALSGPGTMHPVHQSRSLVIRQTLPVHRKILQLLRDLREAKGQADREKP
jgi:general secretion pathway protein D